MLAIIGSLHYQLKVNSMLNQCPSQLQRFHLNGRNDRIPDPYNPHRNVHCSSFLVKVLENN